VVSGTGGRANWHRGVVVELEDGTATQDKDLRRPTMRSSSAAAKLDGARGFASDYYNHQKGRSEWQARALDGAEGISSAWQMSAALGLAWSEWSGL
jgi:hypothetical protein